MEKKLFLNPGAEHRGAPFWAWNGKLDRERMLRQINVFAEMGMGGFHMHSRTGLATPYLGGDFMDCVSACVDYAKSKGMLAYLYDEDRYSSGFGGGFVTKDLSLRKRWIEMTTAYEPESEILSAFDIELDGEGYLKSYKKAEPDTEPRGRRWYAVKRVAPDRSWCNNQAAVDTLNPRATARFIEVTHERYKEKVGGDFGTVIPSIFTDEPQFQPFGALSFPGDETPICIPYTDDLAGSFEEEYGYNCLDRLPELVWEPAGGEFSPFRYQYKAHVTARFASAYAGVIGEWCERNHIALTGHMMSEQTLGSQSGSVGDVMQSLAKFQMPGIDILCDNHEYLTAKQAQSVAHQYGRRGVTSELYGVTNWDFSFKGHKLQGDWQAALGITLRVHHVAWYSMQGEGKRDYPASIGYQSPWYEEYRMIEDHFARVNAAMEAGTPLVRVGVIHPIESYWMTTGPHSQTFALQNEIEEGFGNIIQWSLQNLLDFDLLSEALLPELVQKAEMPLKVGHMSYDVIVVPPSITLRSTTIALLEEFQRAGGRVLFMGRTADHADGFPDGRAAGLAAKCEMPEMSESSYTAALEAVRLLDIRLQNGERPSNFLYSMRQHEDGKSRTVFIAHAHEEVHDDFWSAIREEPHWTDRLTVTFDGLWELTLLDSQTGEIRPAEAVYENGRTIAVFDVSIHGSLLLEMKATGGTAANADLKEKPAEAEGRPTEDEPVLVKRLKTISSVEPLEPNVLLLDMAEYRLDDEAWREAEEVLHLDSRLRSELGYVPREEAGAQPWTDTSEDIRGHVLTLRYMIDVRSPLENIYIAMEKAAEKTIMLDGSPIEMKIDGWYVDEDINRLRIGELSAGIHELLVKIPYGKKAEVESAYLLGDFSVYHNGSKAWLDSSKKTCEFGDLTRQGYSFYGGNIKYTCEFEWDESSLVLQIPGFGGSLLSVSIDGEAAGRIAWAPYKLELGRPGAGRHTLEITVFGNRFNTFGQLHNCDPTYSWFASCSWRTEGSRFSNEYQVKPAGILTGPMLLKGF